MNNFQQLLKDDEENYKDQQEEIRSNLENTFGFFRFFGQVLEVYLPRMVDVIVMVSGGDGDEPPAIPPHFEPPSSGGAPDYPGQKGPDSNDDIIPRT